MDTSMDLFTSQRQELLASAMKRLEGRGETHDSPEQSFERIARLWSSYLETTISKHEVAIMMILMKVGRLQSFPNHRDSWVDIAGYAACGGEITNAV